MTEIPCISLWQPWASLIGKGKSIETRHWPIPTRFIGKRIAIHAAKRPLTHDDRVLFDICAPLGYTLEELPFGAIVSTAVVVACFQIPCQREPRIVLRGGEQEIIYLPPDDEVEALLGNYEAGRYAWVMDDVQHIEKPIPMRGQQGFWQVNLEAEAGRVEEICLL